MVSIIIGGNTYSAYTSIANADVYMGSALGDVGTAWRAADTTTKGMALVTATQAIDAYAWGDSVTSDATWQAAIVNACAVLAATLIEGSFTDSKAQLTDQTKRLKAGSAEVEFFFRTKTGSTATLPFPPQFMALMGKWLSSSSGSVSAPAGSASFGICEPSHFDCGKFDVTQGF